MGQEPAGLTWIPPSASSLSLPPGLMPPPPVISQPVFCWWSDRQIRSRQLLLTTVPGFSLYSGSGGGFFGAVTALYSYASVGVWVSPTGPQSLPSLQGPAQSLVHSRSPIGICLIAESMSEWADEHPLGGLSVRAGKDPGCFLGGQDL